MKQTEYGTCKRKWRKIRYYVNKVLGKQQKC